MITISKLREILNREYTWFIIARVIAVFVKPTLLWYTLRQEYAFTAENIALMYLVSGSLMVILNNEAHFDYYKEVFTIKGEVNRRFKSEISYYERMVIHFLLFCIPMMIGVYVMTHSILLTFLFFIVLCFEKIFDEIQRLFQFKRRFKDWSKIILLQLLTPLFVVLLASLLIDQDEIIFYIYLASYVGVMFFIIQNNTVRSQWKLVQRKIKTINKQVLNTYYIDYKDKMGLNQLQSFSGRNIPLFDRFMIKMVSEGLLAPFSIVAQMGSLPILIMDYFLISHRRNEYIQKKDDVMSIVKWPVLILYTIGSLLVFEGIAFVLLNFFNVKEIAVIPEHIVYLVGIYYALYALSQHFSQFSFWNRKRKFTLSIDALFYLVVVIFFFIKPFEDLMSNLILGLIIGHILRLTSLFLLSLAKDQKFEFE